MKYLHEKQERESAWGSGLEFRDHDHSRIRMPGTSFYAGPSSEPEARIAALDLAQAEAMVLLGRRAGPTMGLLRGYQRLVVPGVNLSRCRRVGYVCPPVSPLA